MRSGLPMFLPTALVLTFEPAVARDAPLQNTSDILIGRGLQLG